jgi:N,N'-diacetyllegionaminate synthase
MGGRPIGGSAPCFVIAEAGVNHNGELALAHRLVDAAADAGADAVKFQTFDPDALVSPAAPKAPYQTQRTPAGETQLAMLRRLALSRTAHAELRDHAAARDLLFLSTPFDEGSADFLEALGLSGFKVSSGDLTNLPLLAHLARKGRPLLVSTGMSDIAEVGDAVRTIEAAGSPPLALFHCTSSYPAPSDSANLRAIGTLRSLFGRPVGYSDHTLEVEVALAAVALGAQLLEKHLTLDRALPGPDHAASMEPPALRGLISSLKTVEGALGDGVKVAQPCERELRLVARRSLHAIRDLEEGAILDASDLAARRPATGVSPARLPVLVGRRLRRRVSAGSAVVETDLE